MRKLLVLAVMAAVVAALGLLPATQTSATHQDGLVAYWPFDDETAADAAHTNDGTLNGGASFSSDVPSTPGNVKSLALDGSGDYVSVADDASLALSSFTISAWVSLDVNNTVNNIVTKDTAGNSTNYNVHVWANHVALAVTFAPGATVDVFSSGSVAACEVSGNCYVQGTSSFVDGPNPLETWRHVSAAYDAFTKTMTVYLDGALDGQVSFTTGVSPATNSELLQIGKRQAFGGEPWDGLIDEVCIWDRALSASEIDILGSGAVSCNGLVKIDIKPGSDPNCINDNDHGVIPVAILSTATFDATTVDPASVTLGALTIRMAGKSNKYMAHAEDVNGDGLDDLVVKIEDTDGFLANGSGMATLSGTAGGTPIAGTDLVCAVP